MPMHTSVRRVRSLPQILSVPTRAFVLALVVVEVFNSFLLVFIGSFAESLSSSDGDESRGTSTSLARVPMGIGVLGLVALAVYISMKTRRALDEMRAAADAANGGAATVAVGAQPPSDKPTDAHIRLRSSGKSVPCL